MGSERWNEGVLFKQQNASTVEQLAAALPISYFMAELNSHWGMLLPDATLASPALIAWLRQASTDLPLLYFYDVTLRSSELHGWGYHLFHGGNEIALVDVDYDLAAKLCASRVAAQHPNSPKQQFLLLTSEGYFKLEQEILDSDVYHTAIEQQYARRHTSAFSVLGIADNIRDLLEEYLDC